ncbi:MAG: AAA family ATPase [Bacteroidetes bacterium]|nr:AAA family ATPase [Bacteroidota bacterium]
MEQLIEKYRRRIDAVSLDFIRSQELSINWDSRLIGIKGARGIGKTTLLLQHLKQHFGEDPQALYVSLDNIWFAQNSLSELADRFIKQGGKYLYLDEVHKYPDWSKEIKNCYDDYPQLQMVFTGSSLLEILNARADLSRRAIIYRMQGLSFREYLNLTLGTTFQAISLDELLTAHENIARKVNKTIRPLQYFQVYMESGYYPFFLEGLGLYHQRIEEVANMIIEIELPILRNVDIAYASRIKQLLMIIAESAPFIPNITKLSERIGINRVTLLSYLHYLKESGLIHTLYRESSGITRFQKPEKLFLENTNLAYSFPIPRPDKGTLRETFFMNQLSFAYQVTLPEKGDFLIDGKYTFEVGGKNKTLSLPDSGKHSWIAADEIETGIGQKVPLWLFGFLY